MIFSIEANLSILCPSCNGRFTVPGMTDSTDCPHCFEVIDINEMLEKTRDHGRRYHFGGYYDIFLETVAILKDGEDGIDSGTGHTYTFKYKKHSPVCSSCGSVFNENDLLNGTQSGRISCNCGRPVTVENNRKILDYWDQRLLCIVNNRSKTEDKTTETFFAENSERQAGKNIFIILWRLFGLYKLSNTSFFQISG